MTIYKQSAIFYKGILNEKQKEELNSFIIPFDKIKQKKRILEAQEFEFVYISALTENNKYTKMEALLLLTTGKTADNKSLEDALMLKNLDKTFNKFVLNPKPLTLELIKEIHKTLTYGILEENEIGIIRDEPIQIKGIDYIPPNPPKYDKYFLEYELKFLLEQSEKIDNPFEKSIYLHNNIAYLQPFIDGNKRTARIVQSIILAQNSIMPLISNENLIKAYIESLANYYLTTNYNDYIEYYIKAMELQYSNLEKIIIKENK